MKFTPIKEAEIKEQRRARIGLYPKGTYDFECTGASDTTSKKSGKPMIKLTHKVYGENGFKFVDDYIVEGQQDKMYGFCAAVGMIDAYNAGDVEAEDCIGKSGKLRLRIDEGQKKPDEKKEDPDGPDEFYEDKNSVGGYVEVKADAPKAESKTAQKLKPMADKLTDPGEDPDDTGIPF